MGAEIVSAAVAAGSRAARRPGSFRPGGCPGGGGVVGPVDFAYLDPPYNQHRYFTNYHVWETLIRWDAPDYYGVACKRADSKSAATRSDFNSRQTMPTALAEVVSTIDATVVVVSCNDESWLGRDDLVNMCARRGHVELLEFDSRRYVGAQIGIHDPAGHKVGRVSHLHNIERLAVCGPRAEVLGAIEGWRRRVPDWDEAPLFAESADRPVRLRPRTRGLKGGEVTVTTSTVVLALAVFGASAVEMVEALTIVTAAGMTRGWRSALEGTMVAVVVLAALVIAVGVPLARLVPINVLRVAIGALLLVLGLDWLRKAVLRASGHKALHDEDAIYAKTVADLSTEPATEAGNATGGSWRRGRRDATGFTVAFKGVFLEGMEVVLIVITLGASSGHLALAARRGGLCRARCLCRRVPRGAPALRGPGERHEAGRGHHVDELRRLLGWRGVRAPLAGQ